VVLGDHHCGLIYPLVIKPQTMGLCLFCPALPCHALPCHALPCVAILKVAVVKQAACIPHDSLLTAACGTISESNAVVVEA